MIPGLGRSAGEGIGYPLQYSWASLVAQLVKNLTAMWETWGFHPWVEKISWIREKLPTSVSWPGEFHELCSPWGHSRIRLSNFHLLVLQYEELGTYLLVITGSYSQGTGSYTRL